MTPVVLAVDTSSDEGSVALRRGDGRMGVATWRGTASHSIQLMARIEGLLREAGMAVEDVELLAGVVGPGSYTGLRIGLAALTGLSLVSSRPTVGVSSLQAMAWSATSPSRRLIALRHGYRRDVFVQTFDAQAKPLAPPALVAIANLATIEHGNDATWIGDGVAACSDVIRQKFPTAVIGAPLGPLTPAIARRSAIPAAGQPARGLVPLYIRPVDIGAPRIA